MVLACCCAASAPPACAHTGPIQPAAKGDAIGIAFVGMTMVRYYAEFIFEGGQGQHPNGFSHSSLEHLISTCAPLTHVKSPPVVKAAGWRLMIVAICRAFRRST